MPSTIARLIAAVTLATLIACGGTSIVTSVSIDGGNRSIVLGDAITLTATVPVTGYGFAMAAITFPITLP